LVVGMLTIGILVCYHWRAYRNFGIGESMDAAQVGRNLAEGHGFTTDFIRPFSIYLVSEHNKKNIQPTDENQRPDYAQVNDLHPDLANPPVYPLLLAGVITGLFFSAVITLVVSLVDFAQLGGILHWLMGSLGIVGYRAVGVIAVGTAAALNPGNSHIAAAARS